MLPQYLLTTNSLKGDESHCLSKPPPVTLYKKFSENINYTIMKIEQLYTGCLAEAAYYIESEGEVAIIDPMRETQPYLEKAKANKAQIKYVLETHFHADFVSGHLDLAKATGATIVYGPTAQPDFEAYIARDGEELLLGNVKIKVLHTPGHTMESVTYLLIDEQGNDHAIFSGDTLFIGDVGRPDLAVKTNLTQADLAGHLYDSLHNKILPLNDEVIVYPGHGAGSACGKMMSSETVDTLGHQKLVNYALQPMDKATFIKTVTDGLVAPPQYFPKNVLLNKTGYNSIKTIIKQGTQPLDVEAFERMAESKHALILDTRSQEIFPDGFISGSIFIGLDGIFAPWVGTLIEDLRQPILIVADPGREEEVVIRLARVGYDNAIGFLQGGFAAWQAAEKPIDQIKEIIPDQFAERFNADPELKVLDVRKQSEYNSSHLEGVPSFPLDFIYDHLKELSPGQHYYIHCAGGYRSLIAASIMRAWGFNQLTNIKGGYSALSRTNLPRTQFTAPVTLL